MYFIIINSVNFDDLLSVKIVYDKEKARYVVSLYVIVSLNLKQQ